MDNKETGVIVIFCGVIFLLLGLVLLMDTALMAAGNILIIVGVFLSSKTNFLNIFHPRNIQGFFVFIFGVVLLFYKYVLFGFVLEICGLYLLFCDKIPTFRNVIKSITRKVIQNIY